MYTKTHISCAITWCTVRVPPPPHPQTAMSASDAYLEWRATWQAALRPQHGAMENLNMEMSSWESVYRSVSDDNTFRVTVSQVNWIPMTLPMQGRNWLVKGGGWRSAYNPLAVPGQLASGSIPSAPLNDGEFLIAFRFTVLDRLVNGAKWLCRVVFRLGLLFVLVALMAWLYTHMPWGAIGQMGVRALAGLWSGTGSGIGTLVQFVLDLVFPPNKHAVPPAHHHHHHQRPADLTGPELKGD